MKTKVELNNYYELLAVHRALLEAKFTLYPNDSDVTGSQFVADVANRVLDAIISIDEQKGAYKKVDQWEKWRLIDPSRREWQIALSRARSSGQQWLEWNLEDKYNYIRILLSPYIVDDKMIEMFINQVNEAKD